jgi:hypothetical protein
MTIYSILIALVGLGVVAFLFAQVRARRIRERYVWLWLVLLVALGVVALVPGLLDKLALLLGFQLASNLVLTAAATVTFLITVSLSAEVSKLQMSVRTLAEEVAFLRAESTAAAEHQPEDVVRELGATADPTTADDTTA